MAPLFSALMPAHMVVSLQPYEPAFFISKYELIGKDLEIQV